MANHDEYYDVSGRKRTEFSINNKIFDTKPLFPGFQSVEAKGGDTVG